MTTDLARSAGDQHPVKGLMPIPLGLAMKSGLRAGFKRS